VDADLVEQRDCPPPRLRLRGRLPHGPRHGLFPGTLLKLPEGATYTVSAGDTIESVADQHGISPADLTGLNDRVLGDIAADEEIPFERSLDLPTGARAIVNPGDTTALIAQRFGVEEAALLAANNIQAGGNGLPRELELPGGAAYAIQRGDSVRTVVGQFIGNVSAEAVAELNEVGPEEILGSEVVLRLPPVDGYEVRGQTLAEVAEDFSNVEPEELAAANDLEPDEAIRIGTALRLPESAWGTAPPDTRNPGTACVQYAIPQAVFEQLPGVGEPAAPVERPETPSTDVLIKGINNDWVVVADGQEQPPNRGVVLIPRGTVVRFEGVSAVHTINLNGTKEGEDLRIGETRELTFNSPGTFVITCDYHPSMLANIFVE